MPHMFFLKVVSLLHECFFSLRNALLCRYYVLVLAFITPFFAVANAYGTGLTDFDMSSVYGTVGNTLTSDVTRF